MARHERQGGMQAGRQLQGRLAHACRTASGGPSAALCLPRPCQACSRSLARARAPTLKESGALGALGSSQVAPHELVISFQSLSLPLTATEVTAARPPVSVMDRRSHAPAPLKSITATWGGGGEGGGGAGQMVGTRCLVPRLAGALAEACAPPPLCPRRRQTHPHTPTHTPAWARAARTPRGGTAC